MAGLGMGENTPISGDRQLLLKGGGRVLKTRVSDIIGHGFYAEKDEAGDWHNG